MSLIAARVFAGPRARYSPDPLARTAAVGTSSALYMGLPKPPFTANHRLGEWPWWVTSHAAPAPS